MCMLGKMLPFEDFVILNPLFKYQLIRKNFTICLVMCLSKMCYFMNLKPFAKYLVLYLTHPIMAHNFWVNISLQY